eukprot:TRINITY_DN35406_c0_g1_i1.p1 TRINITY_DN35406_c0_g1~~TRINITY_DN35406_c0_g1_i1.p1  ORF type:complete len:375 (+),score=59.58 TRINITY_DN35406_c0_g1_i1:75-1127(+)
MAAAAFVASAAGCAYGVSLCSSAVDHVDSGVDRVGGFGGLVDTRQTHAKRRETTKALNAPVWDDRPRLIARRRVRIQSAFLRASTLQAPALVPPTSPPMSTLSAFETAIARLFTYLKALAGTFSGIALRALHGSLAQLTPATTTLVLVCTLLSGAFGFALGNYRPIRTAADVSRHDLKRKRVLTGVVVAVEDGNTIRIRHRPWWTSWRSVVAENRRVDESVSIRIAAVETPDVGSGDRHSQLCGQQARQFTMTALLDKRVKLKILARDHYDRLVASVTYGRWPFRKHLPDELLRRGLAAVDRQANCAEEHDGKLSRYERLEEDAKRSKRGLWAQKTVVLPSDERREGGDC